MHHKRIGLIFLFNSMLLFGKVCSIGVSSKLDFGSESDDSKSSRYKIIENVNKNDFDGIGVICVSGKCNQTDNVEVNDGGGASADVLVRVRTNVNASGTNKVKEEVPDVPIVAGYGHHGNSGVKSIVQNDFNPPVGVNDRPETIGRSPPMRPFVQAQPLPLPLPNTNYRRNNRPIYHHQTKPDPRHYKNVGFQGDNNVEIQIPHRPHYINHYFGEHPPPQVVWYPNNGPTYNPLEFRRTVTNAPFQYTDWRSLQTNQIPQLTTACTCNDGNNFYPTTQQYHIHNKRTTSVQIDDKLNF